MEQSKLTVREKSRVIKNETVLDYVPDPRGLGYEFYNSMLLNMNAVAQIDAATGETDTYGNLLRRSIRTTLNLLCQGITKDDIICLCTHNHLNSCVPVISAFFLGISVVPLDPLASIKEMTYLLGEVRPRIVFVIPEVLELIEESLDNVDIACEIVVFGSTEKYTEFEDLLQPSDMECDFKPLPIKNITETAVVLFNGIKADNPIICLSHYTVMMQLVNTAFRWNIGKRLYISNYLKEKSKNGFLTVISFATFNWISEIEVFNCCTMTGTTRVICQNFEPITAWRLIDKYNVSFMRCYTFQANQLAKIGKPERIEGKSLRMLVTTGTRFSKGDLLELRKLLPRCFITNAYEQVEVGGPIAMFDFTKPRDILQQYEKPNSCGKLIPGVTCKIVDPITEKILGVNGAGELRYKTNLTLPNELQRFQSVIDVDDNGWTRTGDLAFYDEEKCIYVLDSLEDIFTYKCWQIVPSVMEEIIKKHTAVEEAAVIGIPHETEAISEVPIAIVSLKKGMKDRVTAEDIRTFANLHLSNNIQLKSELKIVRPMPLTATGSTKKYKLRKMILTGIL